jgi:hypothetical protein
LGVKDPKTSYSIDATGTSLRQTASFEPLSVSVRRAVRAGREPKEPEKKEKARLTLYFTYAWRRGGAFAQPIAVSFVVVQELADIINCTKFVAIG